MGRETERTLNGYIGHVRRQKAGSDLYGDRYIKAPDETLEPPSSTPPTDSSSD